MVTISVHEMISVSPVLLSKLLDNFLHFLVRKVGVSQVNGLFVSKLFTQFRRLTGTDVEDSREREWMTPIGIFSSVNLQPGMIDAYAHAGGIVVGPEHVIDVKDHWLPGDIEDGGFLHLLRLISGCTKWQFAGTIHHFYCTDEYFSRFFITKCFLVSENHSFKIVVD